MLFSRVGSPVPWEGKASRWAGRSKSETGKALGETKQVGMGAAVQSGPHSHDHKGEGSGETVRFSTKDTLCMLCSHTQTLLPESFQQISEVGIIHVTLQKSVETQIVAFHLKMKNLIPQMSGMETDCKAQFCPNGDNFKHLQIKIACQLNQCLFEPG